MIKTELIRHTRSLCPVCMRSLPGYLVKNSETGSVRLERTCPEHGHISALVWNGCVDFEDWISREEPLENGISEYCDGDCRGCLAEGNEHGQDTCCVILEVTGNCNLRCPYCFARGGERSDTPSFDELCKAIDIIAVDGNGPLIQFSGGEPTLRDDLPELVNFARKVGCQYTQINTNGIRLSEDEEYVRKLSEAGLDIVFLQFDGTEDEIYRRLRGRDMLDIKLRAIANCDKYHIGVTLVPTVVRGINDNELGNIVRKAAEMFPAVKSVHFQPATYLGRYPGRAVIDRYTLDELMDDICRQTGIPGSALLPSRCDHAMCEFHSTFIVNRSRQLIPVSNRAYNTRVSRTPAAANREYVAEHWRRDRLNSAELGFISDVAPDRLVTNEMPEADFDEMIQLMRFSTLKISAMAFQDAMNIDLERLHRCSLHVYEDGKLLPFCAKYLTPIAHEER